VELLKSLQKILQLHCFDYKCILAAFSLRFISSEPAKQVLSGADIMSSILLNCNVY
jgi:hypothetical protein